jgi:uncharacterized cupredoxin-like copper-binding protein
VRRRLGLALVALALGVAAAVAGYAFDDSAGAGAGGDVLGPGIVTVRLGVEHSRFDADEIRVRPGTTVRFVVDNRDPILHELVVGDESVHARHRTGGERAHPPVPGEVTVQPNDTGLTVYEFTDPGPVEFACHLPAHYEYGMRGTVRVVG